MPKVAKPKTPRKGGFQPGNKIGHRFGSANQPKVPTLDGPAIDEETGAFTASALAVVTHLASLDKSVATIANGIGLRVAEFALLLQRDPDLKDAYEVGRGLSLDHYTSQLRKQGQKLFIPNIAALKMIHQLSDQPLPQDSNNSVNVQILIPGAAPAGNYTEGSNIEHHDDPRLPPAVRPPPLNVSRSLPEPKAEPPPATVTRRREPTREDRSAVWELETAFGINTNTKGMTAAELQRWNKQK